MSQILQTRVDKLLSLPIEGGDFADALDSLSLFYESRGSGNKADAFVESAVNDRERTDTSITKPLGSGTRKKGLVWSARATLRSDLETRSIVLAESYLDKLSPLLDRVNALKDIVRDLDVKCETVESKVHRAEESASTFLSQAFALKQEQTRLEKQMKELQSFVEDYQLEESEKDALRHAPIASGGVNNLFFSALKRAGEVREKCRKLVEGTEHDIDDAEGGVKSLTKRRRRKRVHKRKEKKGQTTVQHGTASSALAVGWTEEAGNENGVERPGDISKVEEAETSSEGFDSSMSGDEDDIHDSEFTTREFLSGSDPSSSDSSLFSSSLGFELLDKVCGEQERALDRLHQWASREFSDTGADFNRGALLLRHAVVELNARPAYLQHLRELFVSTREVQLVRRFIMALTGGDRPIELHSHDTQRYVGDILAWLHQSIASEVELLSSLGLCESVNALTVSQQHRRSSRTSDETTQNAHRKYSNTTANSTDERDKPGEETSTVNIMLSSIFGSLAPPVKSKIKQVIRGLEDVVTAYQLLHLLSFYSKLIPQLLSPDRSYATTSLYGGEERRKNLPRAVLICRQLAMQTFSELLKKLLDRIAASERDVSFPPSLSLGMASLPFSVQSGAIDGESVGDRFGDVSYGYGGSISSTSLDGTYNSDSTSPFSTLPCTRIAAEAASSLLAVHQSAFVEENGNAEGEEELDTHEMRMLIVDGLTDDSDNEEPEGSALVGPIAGASEHSTSSIPRYGDTDEGNGAASTGPSPVDMPDVPSKADQLSSKQEARRTKIRRSLKAISISSCLTRIIHQAIQTVSTLTNPLEPAVKAIVTINNLYALYEALLPFAVASDWTQQLALDSDSWVDIVVDIEIKRLLDDCGVSQLLELIRKAEESSTALVSCEGVDKDSLSSTVNKFYSMLFSLNLSTFDFIQAPRLRSAARQRTLNELLQKYDNIFAALKNEKNEIENPEAFLVHTPEQMRTLLG